MGKSNKLSDSRRQQREQAKQNAKNKASAAQTVKNNKSYTGNKVVQTVTPQKNTSKTATNKSSTNRTSSTNSRSTGTTTQRTSSTNRTSNTNTVRSTGGKNTVTNSNVKQADKVTSARPYQQTVKGLGNTVGITKDDSEQKKAAQQKAIQTANANRLRQTKENLQARRRQPAIDTLNANSVRWHNTTDEAEKNRLHAANNRIRSLYGMTYDDKTGRTYLPKAGQNVNVSRPVELYSGAQQPQTVFDTQEEKDKRYNEIQAEINRMKNAYSGLNNFQFGMSDNKKADRAAKQQLIKTLEKERNAVTGGTTRKVQAAKSIGNQIVGAPAALAETAQQQSANVEESRKNPEYVKLEQQEEQLELTLAGIPSTDADGKMSSEYMQVYNQLQDVKKQKDQLTVKTAVDPNKWGQQRLAKAAEQKANATTGMTEGQKFVADTAISVAGNAPQMATAFIPVVGPAAATAWTGINAAGQRAYELNQQGVAPNEALGRGIVSGVIEAATEKSPMESLANIATKGGKNLVSNIAKQALSEAGEEALSYAANYAADVAANDPNANFSLSEMGQNALGGAAGGAMFAGIGTGVHALRNGVNYLPTARNRNGAAQNQTGPVDTQVQTQYTNTNGGVANGINGQQNGNGDYRTGLSAVGTDNRQSVSGRGDIGRGNSAISSGVLVTSDTRQTMNDRGMVDFGLRESTNDNASFSRALDAAKASNPHGAFVDSQSADTLNSEGTRTFMSQDGMTGAAVKRDGDIVGVFKNSTDNRAGAVNDLIITALSNGGNKLDCYGMGLGKKYTQLGFVPVARMDFNPEYATDWKPEFGTPDVIFWMHNGDAPQTVAAKYGSYQTYSSDYIKSLPTFTDYEQAGKYRDMLLAQQQAAQARNANSQGGIGATLTDAQPNVLYASQNGQVSSQLPTGYLPEGRSTKTKIGARSETRTIPYQSDANEGLYSGEMEMAKLLVDSSNKTGVPIKTYVNEIVTPTMNEVNSTIADVKQYVRDYMKTKAARRGTEKGSNLVHNENGTTTRISNNEAWYSEAYKRLGHTPRVKEYDSIAENIVYGELNNGGGDWVSPQLAQEWGIAQQVQAAYNVIGDDAISAEITPDGLRVTNGTPARTEDIRATNAGRNYVSPAEINNTAQPLNLDGGQSVQQGNVQTNPALRDISPKLRTAAQSAQESAQNIQTEMAQPMQANAQNAALGAQQAAAQTAQAMNLNPTLKRADVTAESSVGAAQTGFDPYSKMVNEYGAIEPGMNSARTIDVPQSTNGTDRVSNVARTIMESGVTPDSLMPALEQNVAEGLFSHDVKSLKTTLDGATKTIQKKGWQGAFDQWEEVTDGRRAVTDDDIALGQMMYTAAVEAGDTQTAMQLAGELAVQGTALGRGVNAYKLLKKTTPEGQLYYLQKAVQKIQQEYQSRFDKQASKAAKKQGVPAQDVADQYGLKLNEDLVQEFLNAETQEARDAVVNKIYDDVAQQIPKTAGDRLNAWRYFAMLGNPRTHVRNIMGNVASAIALDASHKVSALGQKVMKQENRTRALHTSKEARQFARADYANVEGELTGNAYKTEMSEIKQRQKLFSKPLQKVMDANSWALDAEDLLFKKKSYIDSMGNFLTARGWDVNNLSEAQLNEARQHAIQDAKIATFQDASALADKLGQIERSNKAAGVIIGSLVPFKRTPINVAKRSFELSPVGLLKAITYDAAQVRKGNMDATKMVDHISEGLTGSGVAALGVFLASQGIFSAGSSDDDKEANLEAGMGQQEYAINLFGKSYTIDWAAPAVVPLAMGGELYNALQQKYDDDETAFNQAMGTVSRMFEPLLNMTMLSGIGSTISSAAYNKSNALFGIGSNIATNFGGQFVPTLFGQIARTVDNTRRSTYADKNSAVPSSVQKFLQRQANKIPGLSKNQPAYTDVWGREQKNGPDNVFARAAYNFFSPGYMADLKSTQAEKTLKELYQTTGDNSVLPSKPQAYYKTADGTKKFLSAQDYSKLTTENGKVALDALDKLTKSEAYKAMTNAEKIEAVADVYKYAKAVSANKVYGKELEGTIATVKDSGIEPGLYYAYKEMEDSYNDSMESWEARDQTFNAIKSDKSLSDQEKNSLYHTLLIKGTSDSQWEKYQEISDKVTAEEYVDAMIQKQAITKEGETIEKGRAAQEATEFSYYLDSKGYSAEKRQALEDTFKFYSMVKADPANYTFDMIRENGSAKEKEAIGAVESAGLTAPQYAQIKNATSGVTYEKGKTGAKKAAVAAVVSKNVENASQFTAVMNALGYKKTDGLYTSGGKLPEDKTASTGITVNRASGFNNPTTVSDAVVTSGFGGRSATKTSEGYSSTNHDGIDIGGSVNGQAADSIGGGKVIAVGYDENGYGNYVEVDHGNGYTSLYGHLQKATVKQGDTISAGQQVGVIGSTGNSSGPHLHLRVHKNGQPVDPRTVIPGYGG